MPVATLSVAEHTKKTGGLCARRDEGITRYSFGQCVALICASRLNELHLAQLALFVHHVKMKMRQNKHRTIVSRVKAPHCRGYHMPGRVLVRNVQYTSEGDRATAQRDQTTTRATKIQGDTYSYIGGLLTYPPVATRL